MPDKIQKLTARQLLTAYRAGRREFHKVQADHVDLTGARIHGASFYYASLRGANFTQASLTHVQFKGADLSDAILRRSSLNATDLIAANFHNADMREVDLTGAAMAATDCTGADMRRALFNNTSLQGALFAGARLDGARIGDTHFTDVDVTPFCRVSTIKHHSPSYIDSRTVMRSYTHPGLKSFMVQCGVPEIFAEYMIDCAKALDLPLIRRMMQSTFISYGAPDEAFARRLYGALRSHNVVVFFFPETATMGERIADEIFRRIQEHDRVLLVCSRNSLDRGGVLNEIHETLAREARDGGATYLLPITLDDYVFKGWKKKQPQLAERISSRIIGDFRGARRDPQNFERALARLLDALKVKRPGRPAGAGSMAGDATAAAHRTPAGPSRRAGR